MRIGRQEAEAHPTLGDQVAHPAVFVGAQIVQDDGVTRPKLRGESAPHPGHEALGFAAGQHVLIVSQLVASVSSEISRSRPISLSGGLAMRAVLSCSERSIDIVS